jgi:5'-nucleotidase
VAASSWIAVLGTVAAVFTTVAFVPQIVKTWRQGGRDLSYGMLLVFLTGVFLWMAYGLFIGSLPVLVSNVATGFLVCVNVALKWWHERRPAAPPLRPRVAIDMDEVLADAVGKHLRRYNETFGTRLTVEDVVNRGINGCIPAERMAAAEALLHEPSFFRDLDCIAESVDTVRALSERYDVFVASAAMEVPGSFADKYAWLREHFPFIPPSHIVFCGDKSVVNADYLIDDSPRQLARFKGQPLLFDAPHNRHETRFTRVHGWAEVRRLLLGDDAAGLNPRSARVPSGLPARA